MKFRSGQVLCEFGERLKVASENGVDEDARVFGGVSGGNVDDVGFNDDGAGAVVGGARVESCDGSVVGEAVVAADHAESDDVALVVEDVEAFGAHGGGEAGDDADLAEGADVAVADDDVAALDEVFVGLRVVEAPYDGPDGGDGRGDFLDHGGAALVRGHRVRVVARHRVGDGGDRTSLWWHYFFSFLFFNNK